MKVDIKNNTITLEKDGSRYCYWFDDIELLPDTCRGLKYLTTGELQFNVQGKQAPLTDNTSDEDMYRGKQFTFQNKMVERIQLYQNKWFCTVCQQRILKPSCYFSRVLPLPSENWSDFADMWFCHKHEEAETNGCKSNGFQNGKLLPKQQDCLVGDTYVLLSDCQVNRDNVKIGKDGAVTCSRCGCQIGVVIDCKDGELNGSLIYKLFLSSLTICDLDFRICEKDNRLADRQRRERFFSMLLEDQSQVYTSFRFIIESPVTTTVNSICSTNTSHCLIWLLDTKASVYAGESSNIQKTDLHQTDCTRTFKLARKRVLKLLFKCQLETGVDRPQDFTTKPLISMWQKDNTVHSLKLPHPLFLQLVDQLISNSRSLPVSQRMLNGFHVSFLGKADSDFET